MSIERVNPRHSIGFLTWKASRIFINDMAARLAEAGMSISVEQLRPLFALYRAGPLSQGSLCKILSQEKTGVSRLVAGLERRGFVSREASLDDRRVKNLSITDAGLVVVDTALDLIQASRDKLVSTIDPDDFEVCKRVLWQIIEPHLGCCGEEGEALSGKGVENESHEI